jgi:hypothetical protein
LLEDNVSKFGTLVLVNKRTPLSPGFNKAVQIGRSVINFSVKQLGPSSIKIEGGMIKVPEKGLNENEEVEDIEVK